jgi:hypothetical protein
MLAMRSLLAAAALALAISVGLTSAVSAAPRKVPRGFYGVMYDGVLAGAPLETQRKQFDLMARSGVESVRTVISWNGVQHFKGSEFNFKGTDPTVQLAAERGMSVLPVLLYTPPWARVIENRQYSPPRIRPFQAFLRAAIKRYGTNGSFWAENPTIPKRPVRDWQIWNEPNLTFPNGRGVFWDARRGTRSAYPRGYAALLRASHRTIESTDRAARTVMGGLVGPSWIELRRLYRYRVKGHFDAMAVHVYPQTVERVFAALRRVRNEMRAKGQGRVPLYLTETAFPSSRGRVRPIEGQRQETKPGMARRLTGLFKQATRDRRALGLQRVYWYTWASGYRHRTSNFEYAGLLAASKDGLSYKPQPALKAFRRSAARHQGCRKSVFGRCL